MRHSKQLDSASISQLAGGGGRGRVKSSFVLSLSISLFLVGDIDRTDAVQNALTFVTNLLLLLFFWVSFVLSFLPALNMLEADVKKEYLEALDAVPDLVATESARIKFLRVEQNNPWKAARRLAMYWKFRKELCGCDDDDDDDDDNDRWLRPMTSTGKGVLTTEDVDLLRRGIYHYSHAPGYGPVLVIDGSRNKGASIETCDRVVFYLASVIDDEAIQTKGVSIVYAVTSDDTESKISNRLGVYVALGLPVRIRKFVVIQNYEPGREALCEYLAVRRKLQVDMNFGGGNGNGNNGGVCELITSDQSRSDLLSAASRAGIPWIALPKACGGRFGQDALCDWLRQRMTVEECLTLNTTTRAVQVRIPSHRRDHHNNNNTNNNHQQVVVTTGRKRKASTDSSTIPSASGRRGPWRCFRDALEQQAERLRHDNLALQADNRRLEECLLQARKVSLEHQMAAMTGKLPTALPQQQPASRTAPAKIATPSSIRLPTTTTTTTTAKASATATTVSPISGNVDPPSDRGEVAPKTVMMGPPLPPLPPVVRERSDSDYFFGVDVADPFEQMGDNELAQFILLYPR